MAYKQVTNSVQLFYLNKTAIHLFPTETFENLITKNIR